MKQLETSPKDTALNLINEFNLVISNTSFGGNNFKVKNCALLCVNKILQSILVNTGNSHQQRLINSMYVYWIEVKNELNNL